PVVACALRLVRKTAMGHAQQSAAVTVDKIDFDQARPRRHLFASLPTEAVGETVDRHDLPERSARHSGAVADAFDQIEPARMRLSRRLGAHPAHDIFRIGQEREDRGRRSRDLNLASDHERFSHQCLLALSWLVDAARETPGAGRLLADLGGHLVEDGLPLAGGALTLAVPHPLIARRTWLWRAESGEVIEALGFAPGGPAAAREKGPSNGAGRRWLAGIAAGLVHEDIVGPRPDGPSLSWIGPRQFTFDETKELRQAARFAAAPLAVLAA